MDPNLPERPSTSHQHLLIPKLSECLRRNCLCEFPTLLFPYTYIDLFQQYLLPILPHPRPLAPPFTLGRLRLATERLYLAILPVYGPFLSQLKDLATWEDYGVSLMYCSVGFCEIRIFLDARLFLPMVDILDSLVVQPPGSCLSSSHVSRLGEAPPFPVPKPCRPSSASSRNPTCGRFRKASFSQDFGFLFRRERNLAVVQVIGPHLEK